MLALLSFSGSINAAPDIVGTFSGTLAGREISSMNPVSETTTIIINQQSGNNFNGSLSLSPSGLSTTFTGTFLSDTQIDVICDGSSTIAAGPCFAATFTGTTLIIPGVGQMGSMVLIAVSGPDLELGGTLDFSNEKIINPESSPSTQIKDAGTIQSEVNSISDPVHTHLRKTMHGDAKGGDLNENGFLIEGEGGLNAGDWQLGNMGVWLSYNYTETENDFFRTAFESDRHTVVGGVDFTPTENTVLGLAIAYEDSSTDTTFNAGELDSDGFTIAPYLGVLLSETWSLDASVGLSFIDNDQFRTSGGTRITSSPETDRFYISSNLNGITFVDNWILGGRVGFLYARSSTEDFTESDGTAVAKRTTKLGQFRIGGDAAYSYGNWEPFVSALYGYDFSFDEVRLTTGAQPENDRDDILLSFGVRYFNNNNWSGNFEYSKRVFREDFDEDSWTATIRYDF